MPSSHTDIAPASLPSSQSDTPDQTFDYEGFHFFLLDTRSERMQRKIGAGLANATLFKDRRRRDDGRSGDVAFEKWREVHSVATRP